MHTRIHGSLLRAVFVSAIAASAAACAGVATDDVATERYPLGEESICGPTEDFQDVEQYDGTLGPTVDFVMRKQRAVAQIQWKSDLSKYTNPGNVGGVRWCSGTMIAPDLYLTAGHCFDPDGNGWTWPRVNGTNTPISAAKGAVEMKVNFNYQENAAGGMQTEVSYNVTELVEHRVGGLDYAIIRVAGAPGETFGITPFSTAGKSVGDPLTIIGHPEGLPKKIEAGTVASQDATWLHYGDLDTLGGNSGSGVIDGETGAVIAVHTNGGCYNGGGTNKGVRISAIYQQSDTLKAVAKNEYGFAYAHLTTGSYTALDSWSRNSSGGIAGDGVDNTITNLSTGKYRVDFPNLGYVYGGNVIVSSHGTGNERCSIDHWTMSGSTRQVFVACHTPAGALVNARFVASYMRNGNLSGDGKGAYLWSHQLTGTFNPHYLYSWNSSGALNKVQRTSAGNYTVTLPGQAPQPRGGTVQVTAMDNGGGSNYCKVQSWSASGTNVIVNVDCYNTSGVAADTLFSLNYSPLRASGGKSSGHAWANLPSTASYNPNDTWEYIEISGSGATGSHVSATRSAVGTYSLKYPDLSSTGSTALIVAHGTGPEYCKVASWTGSATETNVAVRCFNPSGVLADSKYVSSYATMQWEWQIIPLPIATVSALP